MGTESPSAFAIVFIIFSLCVSHYGFPIMHYFWIGAFRGKKNGVQTGNTVELADMENEYAVSDSESRDIFKTEKSVVRLLSMHWTFWTYVWIAYFAVTANLEDGKICKYIQLQLNVMGYIHLPVFILFLWGETFFSWESDYLSNMLEGKTCKMYLKELTDVKPDIILSVIAYHWETMTRRTTYKGPNGQIISDIHSDSYRERVRDYEEMLQVRYSRYEDASPDPESMSLNPGKVTRIKMLKMFVLADSDTEAEVNRLRAELKRKARGLYPSSNIEITRQDIIPGFEERVCAYWNGGKKKWWTNKWIYIVTSLLLMTWFYRIAFTFVTQTTCYRVVKKIYIS